jgi:hypothetical protein
MQAKDTTGRTEKEWRSIMNAPRFEPNVRSRPTQTVWPGTRRQDPPAMPRPQDAGHDDKKDDDPAHDEPGYGHGV